MKARQTRLLRCSPMLAGVLAVLAFSLFSWGLAYKLSLYHSHQTSSKMVAAKLLSQKERPISGMVEHAGAPGLPQSAHELPLRKALPVDPLQPGSFGPPFFREDLFTVHTDRKPPPQKLVA